VETEGQSFNYNYSRISDDEDDIHLKGNLNHNFSRIRNQNYDRYGGGVGDGDNDDDDGARGDDDDDVVGYDKHNDENNVEHVHVDSRTTNFNAKSKVKQIVHRSTPISPHNTTRLPLQQTQPQIHQNNHKFVHQQSQQPKPSHQRIKQPSHVAARPIPVDANVHHNAHGHSMDGLVHANVNANANANSIVNATVNVKKTANYNNMSRNNGKNMDNNTVLDNTKISASALSSRKKRLDDQQLVYDTHTDAESDSIYDINHQSGNFYVNDNRSHRRTDRDAGAEGTFLNVNNTSYTNNYYAVNDGEIDLDAGDPSKPTVKPTVKPKFLYLKKHGGITGNKLSHVKSAKLVKHASLNSATLSDKQDRTVIDSAVDSYVRSHQPHHHSHTHHHTAHNHPNVGHLHGHLHGHLNINQSHQNIPNHFGSTEIMMDMGISSKELGNSKIDVMMSQIERECEELGQTLQKRQKDQRNSTLLLTGM
jgi:hypothetical protein